MGKTQEEVDPEGRQEGVGQAGHEGHQDGQGHGGIAGEGHPRHQQGDGGQVEEVP